MGLGDMVGGILGIGGDGGAGATLAQSQALYNNLNIPSVEDQKVYLEELVNQGVITPAQAKTFSQGDTGLKEISTDPRLKDAQMASLNSLQDIANNGGLTLADKAKLGQIDADTAAAEKGSRDAIIQNANARGVGGSGLNLASQLMNEQGAAQRRNQSGLDVAAMAEQRALDALSKSGDLAGNMQNQQFNQQAQTQSAQDAINRFNAQNKQAVQEANLGRQTTAQEQNLGNRQRIADANAATHNQQQQYNKGLVQQNFQNQLSKASGQAGALQNVANLQAGQAARSDQFTGSLIGAGAMLGAGALAKPSDERAKKDIRSGDIDLEDFLRSLEEPKKYEYKDPSRFGEGTHVSIMAQDLEKTPMGKDAVKRDGDGTKLVDYGELLPQIVAALGHLNKKVEARA